MVVVAEDLRLRAAIPVAMVGEVGPHRAIRLCSHCQMQVYPRFQDQ